MILYLTSIIFGMIILLSLTVLILIDDHKAKTLFKLRISRDIRTIFSIKESLHNFLDMIKVPNQFSRVVDKKKVIWSGIFLTHHQFVSLWWLLSMCIVFLIFLISVFGSEDLIFGLLSTAAISLIALVPNLYIQHRIRSRKREVVRSLPVFLDMLTLHLEAGLGFLPALKRITNNIGGVLGEELGRALIQMELGFSKREALGEVANRIPSMDLAHLVEAILLAERLGTSLARTIKIQTNMLRNRRRHKAEAQGRTAPVRIIPALVFFFLPGLLLIYLAPPIINILYR